METGNYINITINKGVKTITIHISIDNYFYFKGSPWRDLISNAILRLQEKGDIQELYKKWWEKEDINTEQRCEDVSEKKDSLNELSLSYVSGVFVVTFGGLFLSFFLTFLEFVWKSKISSNKNNIALNENLKNGFKHSIKKFFKTEFDNPFFKKTSDSNTTNADKDTELSKSEERETVPNTGLASSSSSRRNSKKEMLRTNSRELSTYSGDDDSDNNLSYAQPNKSASNFKILKNQDNSARCTYTLVNDDYIATVENSSSEINGIYSTVNSTKNRNNTKLNTII